MYLIAEAEYLSDMEGIDSFFDMYAPAWLPEAATAFEAAGVAEIAAKLRVVPSNAAVGDPRLDRLDGLVTAWTGYDHEALRRVVTERRTNLWLPPSRGVTEAGGAG
jgi:hypothetical protein